MLVKLDPRFDELYTTEKPIILITGGRGSGKTTAATLWLKDLSYTKNQVILFTRYTMTSAKVSIIPEFTKRMDTEGDASNFRTAGAIIKNKRSGSKIIFSGIKVSSKNQTANLKGIEGLSTFVVDEAEEWQDEEDYDTLRLSTRTTEAKNRTLIIMNPCATTHFVYRKYIKDTHRLEIVDGVEVQISTHPRVCHIHTSYLDNMEHLSKDFLADVEDIKASDDDQYQHKVIGRWNDGNTEGSLFAWDQVKDIFSNFPSIDKKKYIVCDAAKYGRDLCVTMVFKGWEVIHISVLKKSDVHDILNDIEGLRKKFNVQKSNCLVDGDGVGSDAVKMGGYKSFHGGAKPYKTSHVHENYKNFKTQCAFYLAEEVINKGEMLINANNQTITVDGSFTTKIKMGTKVVDVRDLIQEDLKCIKYTNVDGEGKKNINTKDNQKLLIGRSPDFFDVLNMRAWFEFRPKNIYL